MFKVHSGTDFNLDQSLKHPCSVLLINELGNDSCIMNGIWWMLVGKLEFETYLGVAQELCDAKESVLKQKTNSRSWFRLREYSNLSAAFNTAWCQLVFFVYVLYKSLCKIKSCQNFTPKRDDSTFVSFKWEFPRDDWALSAFSKKEILIHISCTESVDFYYFLTVFHRYKYTYLELIFIKKT